MMSSQPAPWKTYRQCVHSITSHFPTKYTHCRALAPLKYGDALWSAAACPSSLRVRPDIDYREPGPIYSYRRVKLGDVGYIRRGRFHLLFSAGIPLGSRVRGVDVPFAFEPLDTGPIIPSKTRSPGYLRSRTVKKVGVEDGGSLAVAW